MTTSPASEMPAAFIGYKIEERTGNLLVRCCSWCSDHGDLEAWAKSRKLTVTHGLCQHHFQQQIAALGGETQEATHQ